MKRNARVLRMGIIVAVVSGLILAAIKAAVPHVWSFTCNAISVLVAAVAAFWSHLNAPSSVPHWVLYLLVALLLSYACRSLARLHHNKSANDFYRTYKTDIFFGIRWKWHYGRNNEPVDIWGECPQCKTDIIYSYNDLFQRTEFKCETCCMNLAELDGNIRFILSKVARQVERKIRTGEWKVNESIQQPTERDK